MTDYVISSRKLTALSLELSDEIVNDLRSRPLSSELMKERESVLDKIQSFKERMWEKYGENVMPIWEITNLITSMRCEP